MKSVVRLLSKMMGPQVQGMRQAQYEEMQLSRDKFFNIKENRFKGLATIPYIYK